MDLFGTTFSSLVVVLLCFLLVWYLFRQGHEFRREQRLRCLQRHARPVLQDQQTKNSQTIDMITEYQEITDALLSPIAKLYEAENVEEELNAHQRQYLNRYEGHTIQEYVDKVIDNVYKLSDAKEWFQTQIESELEIIRILSDTALEARWQRKGLS